jgi:hypothetical protein
VHGFLSRFSSVHPMSATQPTIDTEREPPLPKAYECTFCGAEVALLFTAMSVQDGYEPDGQFRWRYFAGYRCADREACAGRQPVQEPSPEQSDGPKEAEDVDWM